MRSSGWRPPEAKEPRRSLDPDLVSSPAGPERPVLAKTGRRGSRVPGEEGAGGRLRRAVPSARQWGATEGYGGRVCQALRCSH